MPQSASPATAFKAHDHRSCCGDVMRRAESMAAEAGLRLTPVRRRALEILLEEHRALGAYEVLDRLAQSGFARQPPVAYRALEFLVRAGLAHRIRRLNAFAACMRPGQPHMPAFFICTRCQSVAEAPIAGVGAAMDEAAREMGFKVERMNVEAAGICPACRQGEGAP